MYLCDTCDRDFDSLDEVLDHESQCSLKGGNVEERQKKQFFRYLELNKKNAPIDPDSPEKEPDNGERTRPKRRLRKQPKTSSYGKFLTIDLCSPLGRYILQNLDTSNSRSLGPSDFNAINIPKAKNGEGNVGVRTRRKASKRAVHIYSFTAEQRRRRLLSIETGLSPRSLVEFLKCKKKRCKVSLKKIKVPKPEKIEEIKPAAAAAVEDDDEVIILDGPDGPS